MVFYVGKIHLSIYSKLFTFVRTLMEGLILSHVKVVGSFEYKERSIRRGWGGVRL